MIRKLFYIVLFFLLVLFPINKVFASDTELTITAIYTGYWGDSVLLESKGHKLLMDTGTDNKENYLLKYLFDNKINKFDIYLSHYHEDHYGEILDILNGELFKVSKIYLPDITYITKYRKTEEIYKYYYAYSNIYNTALKKGIKIIILKKGNSFTLGDAKIDIIGPTKEYSLEVEKYNNMVVAANHYINNNCLVAKIKVGNTTYLSTADIEYDEELNLTNSGIDLSSDIMKMSHHGGYGSNNDFFIKKVNPEYAFYTYNDDNYMGEALLDYYIWIKDNVNNMQKQANVLSTGYNGNIKYIIRNDEITTIAEKNYSKITVNYLSKEKEELIKNRTLYFSNNRPYYLNDINKQINNYTYSHTLGNTTGFVLNNENIDLIYNKEDKKITIQYLDNSNNSLKETYIASLPYDSSYNISNLVSDIEGYKYSYATLPLTGKIKNNTTIKLYYKKLLKDNNSDNNIGKVNTIGNNTFIFVILEILLLIMVIKYLLTRLKNRIVNAYNSNKRSKNKKRHFIK